MKLGTHRGDTGKDKENEYFMLSFDLIQILESIDFSLKLNLIDLSV